MEQALELPSSYKKARSLYVSFSAVLLIWEFVGINISTEQKIGSVLIGIERPEKVPIILFICICFLFIRLINEWSMLSLEYRKEKAVQRDYIITHAVGALVAIQLFLVSASKAQSNDNFSVYTNNYYLMSILGVYLFLVCIWLSFAYKKFYLEHKPKSLLKDFFEILFFIVLIPSPLYAFASMLSNFIYERDIQLYTLNFILVGFACTYAFERYFTMLLFEPLKEMREDQQ